MLEITGKLNGDNFLKIIKTGLDIKFINCVIDCDSEKPFYEERGDEIYILGFKIVEQKISLIGCTITNSAVVFEYTG